jgi:response regulator RpfG family c-di-GMP phosphodiesterase
MKLSGVTTLLIDNDHYSAIILAQMLRGLGLDAPKVVQTAAAARALLAHYCYDLCICEAALPDMSGAGFVRWVRRQKSQIRFMPILILTGYSHLQNVTEGRDAGVHLICKKPISPQVLYDHIAWVAKPSRAFIETDNYAGPDRRFKSIGPPDGVGRRDTDFPPEAADGDIETDLTDSTKALAQ